MIYKINHANIKDWAANYDGPLFDGILCDPPYELGFMGKSWDSSGIAFDVEMWQNIYKLLKPGAHLLAFSGSRTYHRMAVAIEDAGFEIRDMIEWVYGSGFPKSLNIGKAIDKRGGESIGWFGDWLKEWREENNIPQSKIAELFPSKTGGLTGCVSNWELGNNLPTNEQFNLICETFDLPFKSLEEAEREYIGTKTSGIGKAFTKDGWGSGHQEVKITKGKSEWEGWGTALKPAHEPCVLARKPLDGTVANNVLKHGTGGLNIDGSRVNGKPRTTHKSGNFTGNSNKDAIFPMPNIKTTEPSGRFPANLIHDGSDEVLEVFPETGKSQVRKVKPTESLNKTNTVFATSGYKQRLEGGINDNGGSAARFFYTAKASKSERNAGLDGFEPTITNDGRKKDIDNAFQRGTTLRSNHHPTVKPLSLTKYLATLIKPPKGGRLLVPFSGSGSEMIGALQAGWEYVEGVELTEEYIPIAEARIKYWLQKRDKQGKLL